MIRFRLSGALCAIGLVALLWSGPAPAQDAPGGERASAAPPSSRSKTPLRDPTRARGWRQTLLPQTGVALPTIRLRGRVVSKRSAVALLEIDQQLHVVQQGDQLSLRLAGAAAAPTRGRRRGQPAPVPRQRTVTLRIKKLDARAFEIEVVELKQTLTLR